MVRQGIKGKVVFCSSILGYFSMVGYSTYSPGKFALRGACGRACVHAPFPSRPCL